MGHDMNSGVHAYFMQLIGREKKKLDLQEIEHRRWDSSWKAAQGN